MNFRMLGPTVASSINVNGRIYAGAPGGVYDVIDGDADVLGANGWTKICLSGPTSARPPLAQSGGYWASQGGRYFDTDLAALIVWDGATWRDPATGNAA